MSSTSSVLSSAQRIRSGWRCGRSDVIENRLSGACRLQCAHTQAGGGLTEGDVFTNIYGLPIRSARGARPERVTLGPHVVLFDGETQFAFRGKNGLPAARAMVLG